jgi:hypothetical protein
MTDLTAPGSTSVGLTRLGRDARTTAAELGPLADLLGTWFGTRGWELIAVPDGSKTFRLIVRPYVEILTFEALGAPVPNRGGPAPDLFIAGLIYQTRIADLETGEPLHVENGMWLNLGKSQEQPIVRQASIPHGDVFLALGKASTAAGPPQIPSPSGLPNGEPPGIVGYDESYDGTTPGGFQPRNPNKVLQTTLAKHEVVRTVTLTVCTQQGGGIVNIPFVERQANATAFACTYWIETIKDPTTGEEVQQLQYSQQTNIEFLKARPGSPTPLIMWPHVNVNTLRKQ